MVIHCFLKRSKGVVGHVSRMPYGQPVGERYQVLAMARLDSEKGGEADRADVASAETSDGSGRRKRKGRFLHAHAPARRRIEPPRKGG